MSDAIPSIIASRYRVIEEIGSGGMGVVYRVKHTNTGDELALKLLHPHVLDKAESVEGFKREMRLPAKIKSDHVVKITDADASPELGGAPFLVMELLSGCDLNKVMQRQGRCSAEEVVWVLRQAARALDKAHGLGIVHRDLKPENLFLHQRGDDRMLMVKILDFGIAKLTQEVRKSAGTNSMVLSRAKPLASSNSIYGSGKTSAAGTPLYMAPEQAQAGNQPGAENKVGPSADIWALGMMVFELLTGLTYWDAETPLAILGQLLFAPIKAPSTRSKLLPAAFDDWFLRSCNREPAKRWRTAGEQARALAVALGLPTGRPSLAPGHADSASTPPQSLQRLVHQILRERFRASTSDSLNEGIEEDETIPHYKLSSPIGPELKTELKAGPKLAAAPDVRGASREEPKPLVAKPNDRTVRLPPGSRPISPTGDTLFAPPPDSSAPKAALKSWLLAAQRWFGAKTAALQARVPWLKTLPLDTVRWIVMGAIAAFALLLLGLLVQTAARPTSAVTPPDLGEPAAALDLSTPDDLVSTPDLAQAGSTGRPGRNPKNPKQGLEPSGKRPRKTTH
jgi:serine/threonine protein kinase